TLRSTVRQWSSVVVRRRIRPSIRRGLVAAASTVRSSTLRHRQARRRAPSCRSFSLCLVTVFWFFEARAVVSLLRVVPRQFLSQRTLRWSTGAVQRRRSSQPEHSCILRYPRLTVVLVRWRPLRASSTWPILMVQTVITGLVTWRNLTLPGRIRMLLPAMGERGGFFYSRGLGLPRCWSSSWPLTSRRRLVGVEVAAPVDLVLRSTCTSIRLGP